MELLAPAGDMEKMRTAIRYGADAVYLSTGHFGLRAASANFTPRELKEAVTYAHDRGVRVYLALNILAHPDDIGQLRGQLDDLLAAGPDACIVSDPGIFSLLRGLSPNLAIHISTQASVTNSEACRFWFRQGARRIVLARELTLAEIRQIRADTEPELELEAFVHGAMCLAYSGRCLLSSYLTGRDANRGRCAQPCRWPYALVDPADPERSLLLEQDQRGSYLLNSRDLCMIEHLPALAQAGITSLKIEGRVKSSFYVATVIKAYREALDAYLGDPAGWFCRPEWLSDLNKTVHRPFDTGFFFARPQEDAKLSLRQVDCRDAAVVGIVKAWLPDSRLLLVEQRNKIQTGDLLELVQPKGHDVIVTAAGLLDLEQKPIQSTPHPRMLYFLPCDEAVAPDSFIRRAGNKDLPRSDS
jgi:putative protease